MPRPPSPAPGAPGAQPDATTPPQGAADGQTTAPRLRVLVVDDLVDAAESLAVLLRAIGNYEVRTAYDGLAAIEVARELQPHAVFLDIALPKLNGYRVAEQYRQDPLMQGACLIALTGYGQAQDVAQAQQAGFDHHLLKPVDLHQLEAVLNEMAKRVATAENPR
jgi:CheY-like chemotaxis protein